MIAVSLCSVAYAQRTGDVAAESIADHLEEAPQRIDFHSLPDVGFAAFALLEHRDRFLSRPGTPGSLRELRKMERAETSGRIAPNEARIVVHHEEIRLRRRERAARTGDVLQKPPVHGAHPVDA